MIITKSYPVVHEETSSTAQYCAFPMGFFASVQLVSLRMSYGNSAALTVIVSSSLQKIGRDLWRIFYDIRRTRQRTYTT